MFSTHPHQRPLIVTLLFGSLLGTPTNKIAAQDSVTVQAAVLRSPETPPPARKKAPFVLSISGGISLGAYQAGVNWGLLELVRRINDDPNFAAGLDAPAYSLAAVAGASAGNINTLLWAIEACTFRKPAPPDQSLFWQFWVRMGLADLFPEHPQTRSPERGLLDRTLIQDTVFAEIDRRMRSEDLKAGCTIPIGLTLTRIRPDTLLADTLDIETQRFATAFAARVFFTPAGEKQMRFLEPDSALRANRRFGKLVSLAASGADRHFVSDTALREAVEASSAFPLAFQPKELNVWHSGPHSPGYRRDRYIDGGVFDNNPVNLVLDLYSEYYPKGLNRQGQVPGLATLAASQHRQTISMVYVNPGNLRDPLRKARGAPVAPRISPGGLMSVRQLLTGAIPSARQYELQLWARGGQSIPGQERLPDSLRDSLVMRTPTRGHPIVGEHLGAFAAFLGRPFREYDFYVGIYDALQFAAREYVCADSIGPSNCIPRTLSWLITKSGLPFDLVAPPIFARLFAREFPAYPDTGALHTIPLPRGNDSLRVEVLWALTVAQERQFAAPKAQDCHFVTLPAQILCEDGFGRLLHDWRSQPAVLPILRQWRDACKHEHPDERYACEEENNQYNLVLNPSKFFGRTIDRLLVRLEHLEHDVRTDWRAEARRDTVRPDTVPKLDAEPTAEFLHWVYRSRALHPSRTWLDPNPSSIPESSQFAKRVLWALVPYVVTTSVGNGAYQFGYRPTAHLAPHWDLFAPLTIRRSKVPVEIPRGASAPRNKVASQTSLGGGLGVAYRALPGVLGAIISETGITVQQLTSLNDGRRPTDEARWLNELYGDVALGPVHVRVGAWYSPTRDPVDGSRWGLTAGVSDFNGLLYWMGRMLH